MVDVLAEGVLFDFLEIYEPLVLDHSLHISHIGLLHTFLIEVHCPLPEVVFAHQINHIRILK